MSLPLPTIEEARTAESEPRDDVARLEWLRDHARFEEFIDQALNLADEQPARAPLQVCKSEALLAAGRPAEAEAAAASAATLFAQSIEPALAAAALKLWAAARFRQGISLDDSLVAQCLAGLPHDDESVQVLSYWREALGSRAPFRASAPEGPTELSLAEAPAGSVAFELNAIQARANGVPQPLVFIDTGAQHTLVSTAAAEAAGVQVGAATTQLVGFAGLKARPGLLEKLELGGLVLYDVPVMVGDSAPLLALGGQMSLGTELMHHVRFRIDYPGRRVAVEPAGQRDFRRDAPPFWKIPLWTFSQVCLARGQTTDGSLARVLVDTGDRAGTFVSYRWGRRHLPPLQGPTTPIIFRFRKRNLALESLDLGTQSLSAWAVEDTMPGELDRLNLVDILLGHDLLWPYELTIDLEARALELRSGTSPQATEQEGASS